MHPDWEEDGGAVLQVQHLQYGEHLERRGEGRGSVKADGVFAAKADTPSEKQNTVIQGLDTKNFAEMSVSVTIRIFSTAKLPTCDCNMPPHHFCK